MSAIPSGGPTAILLMGYGSPEGPADMPGYLADILHHPPSDAMVEEYRRRYALIGGSPQRRVLEALRGKVEQALARSSEPGAVFLGMKHWHPNVADVVPQITRQGFARVVAVPLSPYASTWILAPYRESLRAGLARASPPVRLEMRAGWHREPEWIRYWARAIRHELAEAGGDRVPVLLSAHSLPQRFQAQGDPYSGLLAETSDLIARAAELSRWSFTYQSAGNTTEPWLGPDITEKILEWKARDATTQLVASFGFVFEHLEVLYDLDHVVRTFAEGHGVRYRRVPMPNDADEVVRALVEVIRRPGAGEVVTLA